MGWSNGVRLLRLLCVMFFIVRQIQYHLLSRQSFHNGFITPLPPLDERKLPNKFVCICLQYKFWDIFYFWLLYSNNTTNNDMCLCGMAFCCWKGEGEGNEREGGWGGLDISLSTWMLFVICCHFVYTCVCPLSHHVVCVYLYVCVCVCVCVCVWNKTPIQHTFCAIQIIFIFHQTTHTPCIKQCPNIKHVHLPETKTLMTAWGTTGRHLTVCYSKQPGPQRLSSQVQVGFCGDVETVFQK